MQWVHRAGRTARQGKSGTNILFVDSSEIKFAMDLEQSLNISFELTNQLIQPVEQGAYFNKF